MRISTNVTKRLPNSEYSFHDTEMENDRGTIPKYLGESKKLRIQLESTRAKMLELAKKMASIELVFWRKVLFSKETPEAGLRVAMGRIRNLSKDIMLEETLANDLPVYKKRIYRQSALHKLEELKNYAKEGGYSGTCAYVWRDLRKGDLSPTDIGSSVTELGMLTRQFIVNDLKRELRILRSNSKFEKKRRPYPSRNVTRIRASMKRHNITLGDIKTTEEELVELSKCRTE